MNDKVGERQGDINTLQQLDILSRKQSKYCRKLTRLINITYASKNLFTSARCSCDAVIPPSNSRSFLEVSAIFLGL